MTCLAEKRGELVHDAALHAAVVVLRGLTDAGQLELVDAELQQIVEREGKSALQGCRRRHSRANRHVAVKHSVEAFEFVAPLDVVEDDTFEGEVVVYGLGEPYYIPTTFVKHIWANPIYSPCYDPVDEDIASKEFPDEVIVGPMGDGNNHNGYLVHDRYETQKLYNMLST